MSLLRKFFLKGASGFEADVTSNNQLKTVIGDDFAYRIDGVLRSTSKGLGSYNFCNGDLLPLLMNFAGTGSVAPATNKAELSVTAGQFIVGQSRVFHEYIPANPQIIEFTGDNLQPIAGTSIEYGLGSDSIVSPYSGSYDGFRYRTDDTTSYFEVLKGGVVKLSVERANWNNPLVGYDFQNFTVMAIDYLYLGGAGARFFVKVGGKFVLAHTFNYAGTDQGTFINNPNLPVRIALRSTTGSRTVNMICARVATEGDVNEILGMVKTVTNGAVGVIFNNANTRYAVLGIRLKSAYRNAVVQALNASVYVNSNDQVQFNLVLNPTVAGVFSYTDVSDSPIQVAVGSNANTVTLGTQLPTVYSGQGSIVGVQGNNTLSQLGSSVNGTMDTLVLTATLISATATILGAINYKS